jgi:PBP1b-binding outer membrane lipoprotein LpoB
MRIQNYLALLLAFSFFAGCQKVETSPKPEVVKEAANSTET